MGDKINVLLLGRGGREHALAWKLTQSLKLKKLFVSPGNAGTGLIAQNVKLDLNNHSEVVAWCKDNKISLVIVGPDALLADGIVDYFSKRGIKIFGPTRATARLEWSKSFAKDFMLSHGIPSAAFKSFKNFKKASEYIIKQKYPLVIKASGLALGKGVIIANSLKEAKEALKDVMVKKIYGKAGEEVIIEEFLEGKEISIHAFCDGKDTILFPASQDHKRIFDGDKGPNTGGMGTIVPVFWVTQELMAEIEKKIIVPIIRGMIKRGTPFKGILFPGIMVTKDGPKVIEINARFGDPEVQSYVRILKSDLLDILLACADGKLAKAKIKWHDKYACCIVAVSGGYPGSYKKGKAISGLNKVEDKDVVVFHAGTKQKNDEILTDGGRVLGVTAIGSTLKTALNKGYRDIKKISFKDVQYRKDIGKKSLVF